MSKSVLLIFSSKSFIVSGLTFRSFIHFEFTFVYDVRTLPRWLSGKESSGQLQETRICGFNL